MSERIRMVLMSLAAVSAMAVSGFADEKSIPVADLPAPIQKAIKKKFPKAEIEKASRETEDGKTTYEVLLEVADKPVDVAFEADGTILEIEKEISFTELPAKVKKSFRAKYPKAKIEKVEEVTKGEDGVPVYEFAIKTEVVMSAKGKLVKAKDDDDDENDDED